MNGFNDENVFISCNDMTTKNLSAIWKKDKATKHYK